MSIKFAILGLLSRKPSTGYELKKVIEESPILYWSGNNNQIYKTLLQLVDEGLATGQVLHQESSPSKKIYTITETGLTELKGWISSPPDSPDFKNPFLIRLAWADLLDAKELGSLLSQYETETKIQLLTRQEQMKREQEACKGHPRQKLMWDMIADNLISACRNELEWVHRMREHLINNEVIEETSGMNYKINENNGTRYIELISAETPIRTENDAVDLLALSCEHDSGLMMIHEKALSDDFFILGTGVAGKILQKLINYKVKTAVVSPEYKTKRGRFNDMAVEANRGGQFRIFESRDAAEKWLLD